MPIHHDEDRPSLDGPDAPRWPDAGWFDAPLVMGRLEAFAAVRQRRALRPPSRVGRWEVTCAGGRVQGVRMRQTSGDDELDALVDALYAEADAPFTAEATFRVRLHPAGSGPWPDHVHGPALLDRRAMTRELPRSRPARVEVELKLEDAWVRQVRVPAPGPDPEIDEACVALFRGAELEEPVTEPRWVVAWVDATTPDW